MGLAMQLQSGTGQFQVLPQGSQSVAHSKWQGRNSAPALQVHIGHTVNICHIHMQTVYSILSGVGVHYMKVGTS
jgi:hypothetical protein